MKINDRRLLSAKHGGRLLKYQDGGKSSKYKPAQFHQQKADSVAALGGKGRQFNKWEISTSNYPRLTDKDPVRDRYEAEIEIPNEMWKEVSDSHIRFTPDRSVIPIATLRKYFGADFMSGYSGGVEPVGAQYTGGVGAYGRYKPVFGSDRQPQPISNIPSRNVAIPSQPASIPPRPTNGIPEPTVRYRRTRDNGTTMFQELIYGPSGELYETRMLTPQEMFDLKVTQPNYGGGRIGKFK